MKRKPIQCPNDPSHKLGEYSDKYDTYPCPVCDIWVEGACDGTSCYFECATRPERPSLE